MALAKAISKYAKDNPEFTFKAGVVEGRVISIKEIQALATMPSKEELYSKLLFLMNAPAQRLVTVMNAVGKDLAVVINQGVEKKKFKRSLIAVVVCGHAPAGDSPATDGFGSCFGQAQVLMALAVAGESRAATRARIEINSGGCAALSPCCLARRMKAKRTGNPACD